MIIGISGKSQSGKDLVGKIIQYLTFPLSKFEYEKDTFKSVEDYIGGSSYYQNKKPLSEWTAEEKFRDAFFLKELNIPGYEIKKFAGKVKEILCLLTGCTMEDLENEEFKNSKMSEEWNIDHFRNTYIQHFNIDLGASKDNYIPTYRQTLQLIGTNLFRDKFNPNTWINALFKNYKEVFIKAGIGNFHDPRPSYRSIGFPKWIITDLRFPNELKAVKDRGGISIRVNRETTELKDFFQLKNRNGSVINAFMHESETALDNAKFGYTIDNNGTIEELVEKVKIILIKENIINE